MSIVKLQLVFLSQPIIINFLIAFLFIIQTIFLFHTILASLWYFQIFQKQVYLSLTPEHFLLKMMQIMKLGSISNFLLELI